MTESIDLRQQRALLKHIEKKWGKQAISILRKKYGTYPNQYQKQADRDIFMRNEIIRKLRKEKEDGKPAWTLRILASVTGLKSPQAILNICSKKVCYNKNLKK